MEFRRTIFLSVLVIALQMNAVFPHTASLEKDTVSVSGNTAEPTFSSYRKTLPQSVIMPGTMILTASLFNDNIIDRSIVKTGQYSPDLWQADIVQYAPLGILGILKLADGGYRTDFMRLAVTFGMASIGTTVVTQGCKYTVRRSRPDGRQRNSFPSGHTATSFLSATMLYKEYQDKPWIGIAGYGIASATGVMRIIENRHWISDVLAGAGSGILMTELSYCLNDLLFEDRPWNRDTRHFITDYDICWQFGIRSGGSILSRINKNADGWNANAKPAYSIGVTATYMPGCIGATLYTGLTQIQWTGDDRLTLLDGEWFHDLPMAGAGITADIPLSARMSLSGQAIAGYGIGDYDYHLLSEDLTPVDFSIKAGARMIADLGITVRTASDNSMTFFSGIDSYSGIWTAWTAGARFNLLF